MAMQDEIFKIIGWIGAVSLLVGYILFSLHLLDKKLLVYHGCNLVSSVMLLANAINTHSGPFIFINTAWSIIAIIGLINEGKKRNNPPANKL